MKHTKLTDEGLEFVVEKEKLSNAEILALMLVFSNLIQEYNRSLGEDPTDYYTIEDCYGIYQGSRLYPIDNPLIGYIKDTDSYVDIKYLYVSENGNILIKCDEISCDIMDLSTEYFNERLDYLEANPGEYTTYVAIL